MPKYLFTSDQRISILPKRIQWIAKFIVDGHSVSEITDKSENNNTTTLRFYYNLYSGTEVCTNAAIKPIIAIRNFVKKFQFPNTRTPESLNDSIGEKMLFAPYRSVIKMLYLMASKSANGTSAISLSEILYYLFCNPIVFTNPSVNYEPIIEDLLDKRNRAIILDDKISEIIEWKQYSRQIREMMNVLVYVSPSFKLRNEILTFSIKSVEDYNDKDFIDELLSYNKIWYPSNYTDFNLSNLEYISYMDTQNIPYNVIEFDTPSNSNRQLPTIDPEIIKAQYHKYITAIRTKPFLLLAGISGTGKSRIVRELAFKSCPKCLQDKDGTTPGNYCMIEVKPNWHDSTELIGFYSNISKGFQFKKFTKFLVKAKMFPKVPFFVCLDEMNLAPVEQYFAEILSIIETRKHPKKEDGSSNNELIKTGVIVESQYFRQLSTLSFTTNETTGNSFSQDLTDRQIYMKLFDIDINTENDIDASLHNQKDLITEGLTLPDNVIIIGTVNMDDTTHQFSRKVIDRAMTIEMNGGNLSEMFGGSKNLEYITDAAEQEKWQKSFAHPFVTADEVLEYYPDKAEQIKNQVVDALEKINKALKGTPFEVSYRVLNELTIMVGVMMSGQESDEKLKNIINQAVDNILLMKILPRIEGDVEMFSLSKEFKNQNTITHDNRLEWLMELAPDIATDNDTTAQHPTAKDKIKEMIDRLNNQGFTRFWP